MTDSQKQIYNYILKYKEKHGEVPTSHTTAKHFKVSRQYIEQVYNQLIREKILRKKAIVSRYEFIPM
jgi:DNA-binding transcriptional regulator YhcF (GntR family)